MREETPMQELFKKYGHLLPDIEQEFLKKEAQYISTQSPSLVSEEIETRLVKFIEHYEQHRETYKKWKPEQIAKVSMKSIFYDLSLLKEGEKDSEEWISVSEKLPEYYKQVIIYTEGRMLFAWSRVSDGDEFYYTSLVSEKTIRGNSVTHWMPLPNPPKQEQQNT